MPSDYICIAAFIISWLEMKLLEELVSFMGEPLGGDGREEANLTPIKPHCRSN